VVVSLFSCAGEAQMSDINSSDMRGKIVYEDANVVFRQLDEHTWIGNGNLAYNESLYIVEGNERALLIDAGTHIPELNSIVASITSKPVTLMVTHLHAIMPDQQLISFPRFTSMQPIWYWCQKICVIITRVK